MTLSGPGPKSACGKPSVPTRESADVVQKLASGKFEIAIYLAGFGTSDRSCDLPGVAAALNNCRNKDTVAFLCALPVQISA
jgi:hypothetical protein